MDNDLKSIDDLCSYLSLFPARISLYNKNISRLRHRFKFNQNVSTLPTDTIVLVCGSCNYFSSIFHLYANFKIIFLFDGHYGKRRLPPCTLPLRRLRHIEVGGATTFTSLVGFHNASVIPTITDLRCSIKHFMDYSLRPSSSNAAQLSSSFTPEHLLPLHNLTVPIVYSTHFTSTGTGARSLTSCEIGLIFGLSSSMSYGLPIAIFPFPPVQILEACLHPLLQVPAPSHISSSRLEIPTLPQPSNTYFPSLQQYMPLTWTQVNYSADKAAKNDDAEPVF